MATLKISNLSVGDWVYYSKENTPYSIRSIYRTGVQDCVILNDDKYPDGVIAFVDRLTPIPITAEILEKNGFESSSSYWSIYKDNGDYIEIWENGDKWYLSVNSVEYTLCDLHWVHQIQHLMRVWGLDKEINL